MHVKLLRRIDTYLIGAFLLLLFRGKYLFARKQKTSLQHPNKILIIRLWWLGSTILTFPMIKQLQEHYGNDVQYDLLGTKRNLFLMKKQGYFDTYFDLFRFRDILKLVTKLKAYDIVIDTEEYFRTSTLLSLRLGKLSVWFGALRNRKIGYTLPVSYDDQQHVVLTFLDLLQPLGIDTKKPAALEPIRLDEKDLSQGDEFLHPFPNKIKVCQHTWGAETSPERFWSTTNRIELIKLLHAHFQDRVVFFLSCTTMDIPYVQAVQAWTDPKITLQIVQLPLFAFSHLVAKCDLMISNDTGPMHVAAAMGTKTIGLFGPNLPQRFGPYSPEKNIALYQGDGTAYINVLLGEFRSCSQTIIDSITPEMVYEQAVKALS